MTLLQMLDRLAMPLAAGALLLGGTAAVAQGQRDRARFRSDDRSRVDTTVAIDKGGSVTVSAGGGDIVITGWSRDQVQVHAVSDGGDIRFDASRSRVNLELTGRSHNSDARLELSVPYGVRVLASTQSGEVSVRSVYSAPWIVTVTTFFFVIELRLRAAAAETAHDPAPGACGHAPIPAAS